MPHYPGSAGRYTRAVQFRSGWRRLRRMLASVAAVGLVAAQALPHDARAFDRPLRLADLCSAGGERGPGLPASSDDGCPHAMPCCGVAPPVSAPPGLPVVVAADVAACIPCAAGPLPQRPRSHRHARAPPA
jgi:hypothetical protein